MGKIKKVGYELCDINVVQSPCSEIDSRLECDTKIEMCGRKVYPVVVAPMAAVTDENNYRVWLDNGFICVVPRTVSFGKRLEICKDTFCSFSLDEAESLLFETYVERFSNDVFYVCVDIAQGTMKRMYNVCSSLKRVYRNIVVMAGNVANPEAYKYYAEAGINYMRLCIGDGSRCTTASNVSIHYPVATLIDEIVSNKCDWEAEHEKSGTEIIVDGGLNNFDDIQKCLALGAFAVMNGSFFAKSEEACGEIRYLGDENEDWSKGLCEVEYKLLSNNPFFKKKKPYREYYGMSTRRAQSECGNVCSKTSEGIVKPFKLCIQSQNGLTIWRVFLPVRCRIQIVVR